MSLRCGCWAEGDATVFGEVHECSKDPELRYTKRALPPLVPSWAFVVPATSEGVDAAVPQPAQYDGDPDGWTELRPFERVLGGDETHD